MNDTTKRDSSQVKLKPRPTRMVGAKTSVRVKALTWKKEGGLWTARSKVGLVYLVDRSPYHDGWWWARDADESEPDWRDGPQTVGEAKAAAQSHYEKLIMQALA